MSPGNCSYLGKNLRILTFAESFRRPWRACFTNTHVTYACCSSVGQAFQLFWSCPKPDEKPRGANRSEPWLGGSCSICSKPPSFPHRIDRSDRAQTRICLCQSCDATASGTQIPATHATRLTQGEKLWLLLMSSPTRHCEPQVSLAKHVIA